MVKLATACDSDPRRFTIEPPFEERYREYVTSRRQRLSALWQRYLYWRKADGMRLPIEPEIPKKVDADESDIIRIRYSNLTGDGGASG